MYQLISLKVYQVKCRSLDNEPLDQAIEPFVQFNMIYYVILPSNGFDVVVLAKF